MTIRPLILLGLGLASSLIGCGGEGAPVAGCEDVAGADAWVDGEPPRFVELWRAGGTHDGEELANPISAAVGPRGRLAVVDFQLGVVGVGADGDWLGPLTRAGSGPGEIGLAVAASWTEESRLVVLDMANGRLVVTGSLEADATTTRTGPSPAGQIDPTALVQVRGGVAGLGLTPDGIMYFLPSAPREETREVLQALLRLTRDGTVDTLATAVAPSVGGDWLPARNLVAPGFSRLILAAAVDGRLAIAGEREGYHIRISDPMGEEVAICRSARGDPLRADETGEETDPENPLADQIPGSPQPEEPSPLGRMFFGRNGRLWVERDRASLHPTELLLGRMGSRYDVFDRSGRYLGELRAPARSRLVAASGDRVWAFETGAFDETWVVAYRLER